MTIGPGAYFVVHYKFPETEKEVSKDEMERGLTIQIPRGECSVILSPSEVVNERANIKVKVSTNIALFLFFSFFLTKVHVVQLFHPRSECFSFLLTFYSR